MTPMRIQTIRIKNFRSLRDISLENLGNMVVLIGANSSGKSNLMEALFLFFNELDEALQRDIGSIDDHIWFNRNPSVPVELSVTIELPRDELQRIFPESVLKYFEVADANHLTLTRVIGGDPSAATWKTNEVSLNGVFMIKNGSPQPPRPVAETEEPEESESKVEEISMIGVPGEFLSVLSQELKGRFTIIGAARDVRADLPSFAGRNPMVDSTILRELVRLGQSDKKVDQEKWVEVTEQFDRVSPKIKDLSVRGSTLALREEEARLYFPLSLMGGGHQEATAIICRLITETDKIVGIEEPEIHLHPELARKLFEELKRISEHQQIFVATHSTIFIDQRGLADSWIFRKTGNGTQVTRIREPDQLRDVLYELGLRPSDIFHADAVVLVEGPSDKVVYPILANKIGIDLLAPGISTIPTHGKSRGDYHLKVWTEVTENVGIPFFMIFDRGALDEAKKLRSRYLEEDINFFVLDKELEDCYPQDKLAKALEQIYGVKVQPEWSEEEEGGYLPADIFEIPRAERIETALKKLGKPTRNWKVKVGRMVAESMERHEIDEQVRRVIERISSELTARTTSR